MGKPILGVKDGNGYPPFPGSPLRRSFADQMPFGLVSCLEEIPREPILESMFFKLLASRERKSVICIERVAAITMI